MGEDEEATLRTLSSYRKIIDNLIERHHGRFVTSAGDSVLVEFASAVNAVHCAVEIQTALKAKTPRFRPNAGPIGAARACRPRSTNLSHDLHQAGRRAIFDPVHVLFGRLIIDVRHEVSGIRVAAPHRHVRVLQVVGR